MRTENERLEFCSPKNHEIDLENDFPGLYPEIVYPKEEEIEDKYKRDDFLLSISQIMLKKTDLIFIEPERKFYYWNYNACVWAERGHGLKTIE